MWYLVVVGLYWTVKDWQVCVKQEEKGQTFVRSDTFFMYLANEFLSSVTGLHSPYCPTYQSSALAYYFSQQPWRRCTSRASNLHHLNRAWPCGNLKRIPAINILFSETKNQAMIGKWGKKVIKCEFVSGAPFGFIINALPHHTAFAVVANSIYLEEYAQPCPERCACPIWMSTLNFGQSFVSKALHCFQNQPGSYLWHLTRAVKNLLRY
jgi:hypothetical protein